MHLAAFLAPDPAVDGDDGLGAAEQVADAFGQVVQGVPVLGEDDDLADVAVGVLDQLVVGEQVAQLGPLPVGAGVADPPGQLLQVLQEADLLVQLGDRAGRGRGVGDLGFDLLGLAAGQVIEVFGVLGQVPAEQLGQAAAQVLVLGRLAARRTASRGACAPAACAVAPATSGSPRGWRRASAAAR